jgi:hypothetical protein
MNHLQYIKSLLEPLPLSLESLNPELAVRLPPPRRKRWRAECTAVPRHPTASLKDPTYYQYTYWYDL